MFSNFAAIDLQAMPSLARSEAKIQGVPCFIATPASLKGFGHVVRDYAKARIAIVPWPQQNWRPIVSGTGNEGGVVEDSFVMERRGEIQYATNRAVGRSHITGW